MDKSMEIAPGIHLLRYPLDSLWTGMVLICRQKVVLIDTAFEPAMDGLLYPYLAKLGMRPGNIDMVINTHIHGDHIGGNNKLRADTQAKFAAHYLGRKKLRDPYLHLNKIRRTFVRYLPFQEIKSGLTPQELDVDLHDGDTIDLGNSTLRVVHTPGHDTEAISLHDSTSGILFTGDALQGRGTMSSGIAFYQDLKAYRNSLRTVETLLSNGAVAAIVASHPFDPIDGIVVKEACADFLRLCWETIGLYDRTLRELLNRAPGEPDLSFLTAKLLESAGLTTQPTVPVLAYHTVAAHLSEIVASMQLDGSTRGDDPDIKSASTSVALAPRMTGPSPERRGVRGNHITNVERKKL